jgi:predicted metal-binding membrane protein
MHVTHQPPTALEVGLERHQSAVIVVLVVVPVACWAWIVAMARDMYGPMTGASRWMMSPSWVPAHLMALWAMWTAMMAAMMLPTAATLIVAFGHAARRRDDTHATRSVYELASGYMAVWAAFSVGATLLQRLLATLLVLSPMMELTVPAAGAVLLVAAGLYQFTPLKYICLRACQSPFGFLIARWRGGRAAAFRLGVDHGLHCCGCCWALMLLLFVGGVMNLFAIVALTALVAIEKSGLLAPWSVRASGAVLVALGIWMLRDML